MLAITEKCRYAQIHSDRPQRWRRKHDEAIVEVSERSTQWGRAPVKINVTIIALTGRSCKWMTGEGQSRKRKT